jgi:hypothetical protein
VNEFDIGKGSGSVGLTAQKNFEFFNVVSAADVDIKHQGLLAGWDFEADLNHFLKITKNF